MADKLSEAAWNAFARKRDLGDAALVQALARLDKVEASDHDERLQALDEVAEQVKKQVVALARRQKELGDRPFKEAKDKLYELLAEAERQQKDTRTAEAAAPDGAEDEEDSPALLTTKMVPLLHQLKKPDVRMHAMIATAGKNTAVLVQRNPVKASRRKLLAEAVDAAGGAKYIVAECLQENAALTFVVAASASGLAKRIRKALRDQTGLNLKVRVRGEDGAEDADLEEGEGAAGIPAAPPLPQDLAKIWAQRFPRVEAAVLAALKGAHPEATKLRALIGFASEKAADRQRLPAALQALDKIEELLATGTKAAPAPPGPRPAGPTAAPDGAASAAFNARLAGLMPEFKPVVAAGGAPGEFIVSKLNEAAAAARRGEFEIAGRLVGDAESELRKSGTATPAGKPAGPAGGAAPTQGRREPAPAITYTQTRLAWVGTRGRIQADLKKLEQAILDAYRDHAVLPEVSRSVRKLDRVLAVFDESLVDHLDQALNATDPAEKMRWHDQARAVIARYQGFLATDPLVKELDGNPFVPIAVQATLAKTLKTLAASIV